MKIILILIHLLLINFPLKSEDPNNCIPYYYRYLVQRANDEYYNVQILKKANEYLEILKNENPECQSIYQKEVSQNIIKIDSVKGTNFNTYPLASYFINSFKNQNFFSDADQIAIDNSMKELKVVMEKLVIKEGQIPILFTVNLDELELNKEQLNRLTELYFSYMFINVHGKNFYAPYNRLEHNEILGDMPLNKNLLDYENLSKIINHIILTEKWNKIFIISLTAHNILSKSYDENKIVQIPNQSFITIDLYKVALDSENSKSNIPILIASMDSTGVNINKYINKKFLIIVYFPLILLAVYLLVKFIINKNTIENKIGIDKYLFNNLFFSLISSILILIIYIKFFPNNFIFNQILADPLETLPNYAWILIYLMNIIQVSLIYLLIYISSIKFIDSSYLLKNKMGLPILFLISSYGLVTALVFKINFYNNIFNELDIKRNDFINYSTVVYIYLYIILSSYYIGLYIQKYIYLKNILKINRVKLEQNDHYDIISLFKERKLLVFRLYISIFLSIVLLSGISHFLEIILKLNINSNLSDLINIVNIVYILPPILVYHFKFYKNEYPASFEKIIYDCIDYDKISNFDELGRLSNKQFKESKTYRINFDRKLIEKKDKIEKSVNYFIVIGDDKSGKTDLIKQKLMKELNIRLEDNVIELDFSKNINSPEDLSIFIEEGELFIPEIASLHESMKMGKYLENQMKSPISNLLEHIPFIGKYIQQFIQSEGLIDLEENLIIIKNEIVKAYIDYIKSELYNSKIDNYVILFKNIHKCNSISFDIILKLFHDIKKEIENRKIIIVLTYNDKYLKNDKFKKRESQVTSFNLLEFHNNKYKSDFLLSPPTYLFNILFTKGFELNKFKIIMRDYYNFPKYPMNDIFIEKIFFTFNINGFIYLHYVNFTLKHYIKANKIFVVNDKFYINEFIDSIELHDEIKKECELIMEELLEDEKFLINIFVILNEKTSLSQLSTIMNLSEIDIEKTIKNIYNKNSYIFESKNFKEIRLNPKIKEYFKEYYNNTNHNEYNNELKFNFCANNFYRSILNEKRIDENDLMKFLNFSFYLSDPKIFVEIYSLFIRLSIFSPDLITKVRRVRNKIPSFYKIENFNSELINNIIYLNSLVKESNIVKRKANIETYNLSDKNLSSIGTLGILCSLYNIRDLFKSKIGKNEFNSIVIRIKSSLKNLLDTNNYENDIINSWIYSVFIFYIKLYIISKDTEEKKISGEILRLFKIKFPEYSHSIEKLINSEQITLYEYYEIKKIYIDFLSKLDSLIDSNDKKLSLETNNCFQKLDLELQKLELENHKLRIINHFLDLVVYNNKNTDELILGIFESKENLEKTFEYSLIKSKDHNNSKGAAIIYQLYSDYLYNNKKYNQAIEKINKSIKKSKEIQDYKGLEYGYETIIKIYQTLLEQNYNKEYEEKLIMYKQALEHNRPIRFNEIKN